MSVDNRSVGMTTGANRRKQRPSMFRRAEVVGMLTYASADCLCQRPALLSVLGRFAFWLPTGADTELGQLNGTARFPPSNEVLMVRVTGSVKTGMRNCWVRSENPLVASKSAPLDRKADVSIAAPYGLYS